MGPNRQSSRPLTSRLCLVLLIGLVHLSPTLGVEPIPHGADAGNVRAADLGLDPSLGFEGSVQKDEKEDTFLNYRPIFNAFREVWGGKKVVGPIILSNNHPSRQTIPPGSSHRFNVPLTDLLSTRALAEEPLPPSYGMLSLESEDVHQELRKRDDALHRIYLTLSVCGLPTADHWTTAAPPGLDMLISKAPRPSSAVKSESSEPQHLQTHEGFVSFVEDFSGDVSFEIKAPDTPGFSGMYTYEVTASIDDAYTSYNDYRSLHLVDSDHQAVMLTTTDLTDPRETDESAIDAWMKTGGPFTVFVHERYDSRLSGLRRSYCGLAESAHVHSGSSGSKSRVTTLGGIAAKQEFYIPGLRAGSAYSAALGLPSNFTKRGAGVPTGGGIVWRQAEFQTNNDSNCQLISGLDFCNSVNYAVPSPSNGSVEGPDLAKVYDTFANASYQNFSLSLQQIPCKTNNDSQYSLATNCDNCDQAYKRWVCAVTIPRCADASIANSAYIPRNASDSSRNQIINNQIQPGPYSELPPCGNLCFGLVQNCHAQLGFACPVPNTWEYNQTYGYTRPNSKEETCNALGGDPGPNGSGSLRPSLSSVLLVAVISSAGISLGII